MIPDNEHMVDPTVKTLVEMFPEDFLRNTARETGVVEPERKIDIPLLFLGNNARIWGTFFKYYPGVKTGIRGKSEDHIEHK